MAQIGNQKHVRCKEQEELAVAKSLFISLKSVWPLFLWEQKTAKKKTRFNKREEGRRSQPFSESICTAFPLHPPSFLPNQVHSFSPGPESQSEPYVGHTYIYIRQKRLAITSVSAGRFKGRLQSFMGLLWFKRGLMFGFWQLILSSFMVQRTQKAGGRQNEKHEGR